MCSRCIMNNKSDDFISFNEEGQCYYCVKSLEKKQELPTISIEDFISKIKDNTKGKQYDCLMGISGGLDSSYLAYLGAVKWGLRILAFHIDDGFDTDLAKQNVKNLCDKANIELFNIAPDPVQYANIIKSFLRAEVPNVAIPQDNLLMAALYKAARKHKIKYFLSGENWALESILQSGKNFGAYDLYHIRKIHEQFGDGPIDKLEFISNYQKQIDISFHNIQTIAPLNYLDYNKDRAIDELNEFSGYRYYAAKHLENKLTKIIQLRWFVEKFGVDKRYSHLSSLIISNQITREEALKEVDKPICNKEELEQDMTYVLNKLDMSRDEFETLIARKGKDHKDYPTDKFYRWFYIAVNFPTLLKKRLSQLTSKK
ncbi:MAG: N-acetyl sugar amidotransferase [Bacilli bacterium]|nr:N-acetyl sugar amidotransferase [Bacilli bacterium]